jgi:hypothetical protein
MTRQPTASRRRRIEFAQTESRGCDGDFSDAQTGQRGAYCFSTFEAVGRMRTVAECLRVSDKRPVVHDSISACSVAFPSVKMPSGNAFVKCRFSLESMLCRYARRHNTLSLYTNM